jgi:nucleotide-binding universal stress UspA family protein
MSEHRIEGSRPAGRSGGRIVVGVDGSDGGRRALDWAMHEAATRNGTVQAVMAWRWDTDDPGPADGEPAAARAERILRDEIAEHVAAVPAHAGVTVAAEVVEGRAADVLVRAAGDADLLVLGSHGHDRVYRTVLGSVAQECVEAATCPVVVIPQGWRS